MKKIILLIMVTILAANVSTAQRSKTIKKQTKSERVMVGPSQQVVMDRKANTNRKLSEAQNEVRSAQDAVNAAQRKLNELPAKQQKEAEKLALKLAKITDPAKREAEQKKFDQKMSKEQSQAQKAYDQALARLYRAQENLDKAYSE